MFYSFFTIMCRVRTSVSGATGVTASGRLGSLARSARSALSDIKNQFRTEDAPGVAVRRRPAAADQAAGSASSSVLRRPAEAPAPSQQAAVPTADTSRSRSQRGGRAPSGSRARSSAPASSAADPGGRSRERSASAAASHRGASRPPQSRAASPASLAADALTPRGQPPAPLKPEIWRAYSGMPTPDETRQALESAAVPNNLTGDWEFQALIAEFLARCQQWTLRPQEFFLPAEFVGPFMSGTDFSSVVAPPSWAAHTARRLELHQKGYWMKLFKDMAADLAEAAQDRELIVPEGSLPTPHASFYLRSHPREKERYRRLWDFTRNYENLKVLGLFPLKNTTVVDGHMFQAGSASSRTLQFPWAGALSLATLCILPCVRALSLASLEHSCGSLVRRLGCVICSARGVDCPRMLWYVFRRVRGLQTHQCHEQPYLKSRRHVATNSLLLAAKLDTPTRL